MEFVIFDTEKNFKKFMNNSNESLNVKISEMHLINKKNFWFETSCTLGSYILNVDERYVHINPHITKIRKNNNITNTIRLTPRNFKYNYNSSYLIIYKKFLWWDIIVHKKKIMTHFMGNPRISNDIPVNGNMYYNTSNSVIYVVLEYYAS